MRLPGGAGGTLDFVESVGLGFFSPSPVSSSVTSLSVGDGLGGT